MAKRYQKSVKKRHIKLKKATRKRQNIKIDKKRHRRGDKSPKNMIKIRGKEGTKKRKNCVKEWDKKGFKEGQKSEKTRQKKHIRSRNFTRLLKYIKKASQR